jgi:hypothetical protein
MMSLPTHSVGTPSKPNGGRTTSVPASAHVPRNVPWSSYVGIAGHELPVIGTDHARMYSFQVVAAGMLSKQGTGTQAQSFLPLGVSFVHCIVSPAAQEPPPRAWSDVAADSCGDTLHATRASAGANRMAAKWRTESSLGTGS